jgi:putative DNA primase/helicase
MTPERIAEFHAKAREVFPKGMDFNDYAQMVKYGFSRDEVQYVIASTIDDYLLPRAKLRMRADLRDPRLIAITCNTADAGRSFGAKGKSWKASYSGLPPEPPGIASGDGDQPGRGPAIEIKPGGLARMVREAEAALSADPPLLFTRTAVLVRPGVIKVQFSDKTKGAAAALHIQSAAAIHGALTERTHWVRRNERTKKLVPHDPPKEVSQIIAARAGQWNLPPIAGTISCPTLRRDGSLLSASGYDHSTGLYNFWQGGDLGLSKPATRNDAEEGLEDLAYLVREFPYESDVDRTILLSGLITPVVRGAIDVAPLHAATAPSPGSGKSYWVDLASMISTGRRCPVQSASRDELETEKRLTSSILAGLPLINLDNVNDELKSDLLCQAVTQLLILVRPLGSSSQIEIENRACFFATGNAFSVTDDLVRRTLICRLDAKMERPENRRFENDPLQIVARDRCRYIRAALQIVRAFLAAGKLPEDLGLKPLAGFDDWSNTVRGALVWLGCPDPAESIKTSRNNDPALQALHAVIIFLRAEFITSPFSVADVIALVDRPRNCDHSHPQEANDEHAAREERERQKAKEQAELRELLLSIAGARGAVNGKRLSTWLRRKSGKIVGGFRIELAGTDSHTGALKFKIATAEPVP